MKFARLTLTAVLTGGLAIACSDNNTPTGPTIGDLAGTWNATQAKFTLAADTSVSLDLIQVGATVTAVVNTDGTYTFVISVPGAPTDSVTGTFTITGTDTFDLTNDDDPGTTLHGTFGLTNSGNTLSLVLPGTTLVDFNQDGTEDEATLDAIFARTS